MASRNQHTSCWKFGGFKARTLISQTCHTYYYNLENLFTRHKYQLDHIWNLNDTSVKVGWQFGVKVLAKWSSWDVYNIVPKSQEWLIVNCVVNASGAAFPTFYIFKGSRMQKNYIKLCKLGTCMVMQKKKHGW